MPSATFLGVPVAALRIDGVQWTPGAIDHMRQRRAEQRAWCPEPEWVTEAVLDPNRIVRVASADVSLKVVGYSTSATRHIKAWIWPWDFEAGLWLIGSATAANSSDIKRYKEVL